jgi:hypothetical protein
MPSKGDNNPMPVKRRPQPIVGHSLSYCVFFSSEERAEIAYPYIRFGGAQMSDSDFVDCPDERAYLNSSQRLSRSVLAELIAICLQHFTWLRSCLTACLESASSTGLASTGRSIFDDVAVIAAREEVRHPLPSDGMIKWTTSVQKY